MAEYGLKPWEYDLLTIDEITAVIEHQDARYRAANER
jgi:hypothetical protein